MQAMVVICCMPWLADLAHEQLLVQLCTLLAAWPEHHAQSFVAALSRTTQELMADIVGSKLQQASTSMTTLFWHFDSRQCVS